MSVMKIVIITVIILLSLDFYLYMVNSFNIEKYTSPDKYGIFLTNTTIPEKGKKIAEDSRAVLCCLARNNEKTCNRSIKMLEGIGKMFKDYRVIIFENDSEDSTREIVKNWESKNEKVTLLNCCSKNSYDCKLKTKTGYSHGVVSNKRMEQMSSFRNEYLKYAYLNYNDYDYLIVTEFDLEGAIDKSGIYDSLEQENWDGIFANGLIPLPPFGVNHSMYDALAFIPHNHNEQSILRRFMGLYLLNFYRPSMIRVDSAFNGFGIYKFNSIIDKYYNIRDDYNCEHVGFHFQLDKLYINKKLLLYPGLQGPKNKLSILKALSNI
jgi:hypothetical protein